MDDLIGYKDGHASDDLIKDGGIETFMEDVIETSKQVPVLVDFWADWCQPCKTLGPILEKVVMEAHGALRLVKINADENQDLAGQLRIQSLPTVLAFKDGQAVNGFAGALPESEIKKFIAGLGGDSHGPDIGDFIAKAFELLGEGETTQAIELFSQIVEAEPSSLEAIGGLARAYIKAGDKDKAKEVLKTITPENHDHPAIAPAFAALAFSDKEVDEGKLIDLKKAAAKNPKDNQALFDLAEGLFAAGYKGEAADALLAIVSRDRKWNDDAARKLLLKMFEAAGPADPFTVENRRKLSSILFS